MKHSKHYLRAGLLIVVGFFAYLIARSLLLPPSFGKYGFYRGDAVGEARERPLAFGTKESCAECHSGVVETHKKGRHESVQCQNCHAPLAVHIKEGAFQEAMPVDRSAALCLRCHSHLPSRPAGFPEISVKEHLEAKGLAMAPTVCLVCHKPHDPQLGAAK